MAEHQDRGCRETLGLPAAAKVVGIIGRLAAMKGHRYFLEAAARLLADHPECHFVIVGDGPLRGELEAMADVLRIKANVRFVGHQADILPFLGIFDVAVIASVFGEGFATVGIEALACRVPLVITDLEVFASIYRNEENVLTVPRADPDALARAIARLLDEPGLSQRLLDGAAALLDECRIETVADRYLAVYDDMARD
jgi:glycosyltransferase involved in cell wall biosynthesis